MSEIIGLAARMILDSRGNPTVEVDCLLESGAFGRAAVPSGASTGEREAVELRDGGDAWNGKGVDKAVEHVENDILGAIVGLEGTNQTEVDSTLIDLDGTPNKSRLGANAILGVSMAVCRAAAEESELPLYRYLGGAVPPRQPIPLLNVINGGAHADNSLEVQEFMLAPVGASTFPEALHMGVRIYHTLKKQLTEQGLSVAVGDEGGFAPNLAGDRAALDQLTTAVKSAGYEPGRDVSFALDVAASEFCRDGVYHLEGKQLSSADMVAHYDALVNDYPIVSIEDGLDENDWDGWQQLTAKVGDRVRLVGDDLFVTNPELLRRGLTEKSANAILIKLNQVGTVSETLEAIRLAQEGGYRVVVSHRSGETEDDFIADLAVGSGAGWIKTGAPCRSDRNAKYNRLLRIEEQIQECSAYGPLNL
ncbi:MAG: phosphopyruvate hydratase [Planctomycetota bacterium]